MVMVKVKENLSWVLFFLNYIFPSTSTKYLFNLMFQSWKWKRTSAECSWIKILASGTISVNTRYVLINILSYFCPLIDQDDMNSWRCDDFFNLHLWLIMWLLVRNWLYQGLMKLISQFWEGKLANGECVDIQCNKNLMSQQEEYFKWISQYPVTPNIWETFS